MKVQSRLTGSRVKQQRGRQGTRGQGPDRQVIGQGTVCRDRVTGRGSGNRIQTRKGDTGQGDKGQGNRADRQVQTDGVRRRGRTPHMAHTN